MKLLLATRSAHKAAEIRRILADVPGLSVLDPEEAGISRDPAEETLEPHDTFEANARSKARYFQERSGLPTVADDSGLEVDALGGAPGVHSKRFAPVSGEVGDAERDLANNARLLERLAGVGQAERTARFVCVAVLVEGPEGPVRTFRGEASGVILDAPRGEGGFGYDPLFFDPELGLTFAQLAAEKKNARSHRGRAFRALAGHLTARTADPSGGTEAR